MGFGHGLGQLYISCIVERGLDSPIIDFDTLHDYVNRIRKADSKLE